jgi:hypothetical protein
MSKLTCDSLLSYAARLHRVCFPQSPPIPFLLSILYWVIQNYCGQVRQLCGWGIVDIYLYDISYACI